MDRRRFLEGSVVAGTLAAAASAGAAEGGVREYYELRGYKLKKDKLALFDAYTKDALIPALNRRGVAPVGVFLPSAEAELVTAYVLLTHKTLDTVWAASRLLEDAEYRTAGKDFLSLPPNDPGFVRVESTLLASFKDWPKVAVPPLDRPRIFELRIYESPSEPAGDKKVEMFNEGGEIEIFKQAGMRPVFFGQQLIGGAQPNLTYMLVSDDMAAHRAAWSKFGGSPAWRKLSTTPGYTNKEVISKITNVFLKPGAGSQL